MVAVRRPISSFGRTTGRRFERSLSVIFLADRATVLTGDSAVRARRYAPPTESRTATRIAPIRITVKVLRVSVADSYDDKYTAQAHPLGFVGSEVFTGLYSLGGGECPVASIFFDTGEQSAAQK